MPLNQAMPIPCGEEVPCGEGIYPRWAAQQPPQKAECDLHGTTRWLGQAERPCAPAPTPDGGEHTICNRPPTPVGASLLAMKSTRFQPQTSPPHRRQTPLLQPPLTHFHQATPPCAFAYNYARIRPLVRLVPGFYCRSCHCSSVVGFSSPVSHLRLHECHPVRPSPALDGGCAHGAFGRAGFGDFTGLLTCAQLPPFV
ncbi:hypothetical protein SAMN03159309_04688 [Pseudomonas sp. NFACC36]|nr:hypothetical protein SAMN03159309_04688 [Pseudomonas sp. NFACC36]